ncbi:T6SS phospholipase effector Tle1-like catalytic domain-containing protein, partial [Pseudomonas putida]|uniref:T6SS phospholipase effector Tle1-like catalytic domain-containing protein n=2 Tax=Pseudomonas TaxID=286 RepID=UPI0009809ADA
MSEVKHAPLWFPPAFPVEGRLPRNVAQVYQNNRRQCQMEADYHDALCVAAGRRLMPPCCKTLHISLFFDGTGNNLNNDLYLSDPRHPTNIARMFRASIGDGHAGGTAHSPGAKGLTDAAGTGNGQYFKYYMPGVGTPFTEVGDLDYSLLGLGGAWYGEERINWGLLMILDALRRTLGLPRLDNTALLKAVKAMGTWAGVESMDGYATRSRELNRQLWALEKPLRIALTQPQPGQVKLLGIKLYVYGFSRGASAARAFVSWLNQLLTRSEPVLALRLSDLRLPISVEYLGLLDTVASVGLADIVPGANGHMSWADGNQELPASSLVKRCLHIVASHEQRLSFPLESIRREKGGYPANSVEVIYPGVHSDQGGGYPPGDQGKAIGENDGLLLSQIALNDLYADAFAHGAPLKVPKETLPVELRHEVWRTMEFAILEEFRVAPTLINRFNAWRQLTLDQPLVQQPLRAEQIEHYQPLPTTTSLEKVLREQMSWITAWRIDRYAFASLKHTPFYLQASDLEADKGDRARAEDKRDQKQAEVVKRRKQQRAREFLSREPNMPLEPGVKDFDADMAQTQLREAAEEFGKAYRGDDRFPQALKFAGPMGMASSILYQKLTAEVRFERQRMKASGQARVSRLFPPPLREINHQNETRRGNVDESRNAAHPEGLLRALFDDQVHDSRAWFMYTLGRERTGSYFGERMVFFG